MSKKQSAKKSPSPEVCRGCGEPLAGGLQCVRVARGSVSAEDSFKETRGKGSTWGMMHAVCFYLCVGDPAAIETMEAQPGAAVQ